MPERRISERDGSANAITLLKHAERLSTSIGVPTGDDRPFILDYATSAAAGDQRGCLSASLGLPRGVQAFLDSVRSVPTVQNFETVLVHGDRARCTRAERLAKGIELPDTVFGEIQECAEKLDVSLDKSIVETVDVKRYGGG